MAVGRITIPRAAPAQSPSISNLIGPLNVQEKVAPLDMAHTRKRMAMSERLSAADRVIDLDAYRQRMAIRARALCRHCGAMLSDGESDEDCSARRDDAVSPPRRRMFRAE